MIPDQLKQMFGLNSKKDVSMANNIWKMLDEMAESSPEQYKEFIQKNLKQGAQEAKQKKQEKQKPFRIKPEKGLLLEFDMLLNQKYLSVSVQSNNHALGEKLQQKLDLSRSKWQQLQKTFPPRPHILLNICYSDRILPPIDKHKKQITPMSISKIKQIQVFYYSLQGPKEHKQQNNTQTIMVQWDYCMILNKEMYEGLMREGVNGKKMLMSLAISYFEQRLQSDRNPLLKMYNPQSYHKLAYYALQKFTIQFNSDKNYFFNNSSQMQQFLLEKQIDIKRTQENPTKTQSKPQQQPKTQIKFKQQQPITSSLITKSQQQQNHTKINQININKNIQQNQSKIKKPLIQVLNQTQTQNKLNESLPYQMKSNDQGYHIEILTIGVSSIDQLTLEISDYKVKLKINKTKQSVEIEFENPINSDSAKAKLKKKAQRLIIDVPFLSKK